MALTLPRISAADMGMLTRSYSGPLNMMDSATTPNPTTERYYGIMDPEKYGLPYHPNNFTFQYGDENALNYLLKTGDKEGTQIQYVRNGDYYDPTIMGTQGWDTNAHSSGANALNIGKVLAAPLAVYGAQQMGLLGQAAAGGAEGALNGSAAVESLWPGATLSGPASAGLTPEVAASLGMSTEGYLLPMGGAAAAGGAAGGAAGSAAGGASSSLPEWLSPSLLKGAATLAGGLLGANGAESGGSGSSSVPMNPNAPPQMYGGAPPPTFQAQGNTETERRMMEYLPGLFGQGQSSAMPPGVTQQLLGLLGRSGLTSGMVPPIRRSLLGTTR